MVATQNPGEFEGTYPLPESQLDRFLLSATMSYPHKESEAPRSERLQPAHPGRTCRCRESTIVALPAGAVREAQAELAQVHLAPELVAYALDIAAASREHSQTSLGLSTRGVVALTRCARIEARLGRRRIRGAGPRQAGRPVGAQPPLGDSARTQHWRVPKRRNW